MWFWGTVLGMFAGAGMFGWAGAYWGALIGLFAGLWLSRPDKATAAAVKSSESEKQIASIQHALTEIRARLDRLEGRAAVTIGDVPVASTEVPSSIGGEAIEAAPAPAVSATGGPAAQITGAPPAMIAAIASVARAEEFSGADAIFAPTQVATPAPSPASSPASSPIVPIPPSSSSRPTPTNEVAPAGPGLIERMLEGNIVAKLGVVILFFGVGFLLKFAYDHGLFPPGLRLLVVAAASAVMFLIGWRVLEAKRTYALVMMGGAMGLLYLDVFFALKTFGIISASLGFLLFAALGVATLFLAVKLDARVFASLGLIGAFLAPILAATGSGNHVLLFSYYLLLNLIILSASWFKSWRELNFTGFLFTFAIAIFWGHSTYRPEHFTTVEPFLIAFFFLYLAIPILFAQRQPPELKGIVDATLIFGVPMSAAMLQAALTRGMGDNILAWSATGAALIYAGLAWALWSREKMRLLAEAHLALAIVFATVAPYFAFRGYPTFAFWTLEGAAIFWMGCRQKSGLARAFAICLQIGASAYFWWMTEGIEYPQPWWNDRVVGCTLIAAAGLHTAWFMHRFVATMSSIEKRLETWAIAWGSVWLLCGFALGAWQEWGTTPVRLSSMLIFMAIGITLYEWLGAQLDWPRLRLSARAHIFLVGLMALLWMDHFPRAHPMEAVGAVAWPLTFAAYFYALHRQRIDGIELPHGWRYALAWVLMLLLATWEALWRYDQHEFGWVFAIGAAGLIAAALRFRLRAAGASVAADAAHIADTKYTHLSNLPMWWAMIWWFAGTHGLIEHRFDAPHHLAMHLATVALSVLVFDVTGRWLAWPALRCVQWLLTIAMLLAAIHLAAHGVNPFRDAQFFAWAMAFAINVFVLLRQQRESSARAAPQQHVALYALALWLVGDEAVWRAGQAGLSLSWQYAAAGFTVAAGLAVGAWGIAKRAWPFGAYASAFQSWSILPLTLLALLWTLMANSICDGTATPLPYLPILNPLDLAQLALLASGVWAITRNEKDASPSGESDRILKLSFAGAAFFWINAALLRSVHQWVGVPFELHALLHSLIAQAALSLLWTVTALVLMLAAGRTTSRAWWMAGAALLAMVVLKLFLNDIGNSGTERVVSFIGVGVLLMVIGYVAPVPPSAKRDAETNVVS